MRNKMKKAQTEIIGLAIVVFLISLIMLFVVQFVLLQKPINYKQTFTQSQLSTNMVNALLRTTAEDCHDLSFSDLFSDCIEGPSIRCSGGELSCDYLQGQLDKSFGDTFEVWQTQYIFEAKDPEGNTKFELKSAECIGAKRMQRFPIKVGYRDAFWVLTICAA